MTFLNIATQKPEVLLLTVHVQPGAKTTSCAGIHGDALKIRLAAPPVDGKANQALIAWLAQTLGCPQNHITLIRGQTGRHKTLAIDAGAKHAVMRTTLEALATN
jgi:uncharacterized protein (TIGR00251 family)